MLASLNSHPRDKFISFDPDSHSYTLIKPGYPPREIEKSVTTFVKTYFEEFDAFKAMKRFDTWKSDCNSKYHNLIRHFADKGCTDREIKNIIKYVWSLNGARSSSLGTALHAYIESYLNFDLPKITQSHGARYGSSKLTDILKDLDMHPHDIYLVSNLNTSESIPSVNYRLNLPPPLPYSKEVCQFRNWMRDNSHLVPYRTEWAVYSKVWDMAGQIDAVFKDGDDYVLVDWKRTQDIDIQNKFGKFGKHPYTSIPDTKFGHYSLQLNIYAKMLSTNYAITPKELRIVQLHPELPNYVETFVDKINF